MRDYGKVTPSFWIGKTGRSLRGDTAAQLVAAYLVTAPGANMIGFYYCPVATIANDTGLSVEGASKGLRRLSEGDFCTYDEGSEWVWVHEMARFQIGAALKPRDKQVTGIARYFENLPESPMKQGFFKRYRHAFHLPFDGVLEADFGRGFEGASEAHRSQEQEQEQEQEQTYPNQGEQTYQGKLYGKGSARRLAVVGGEVCR